LTRRALIAVTLVGFACETAKRNAYDREYERLEQERAQQEAEHQEAQRYAAVIYFATGSAELDEDDRRELRWFAEKMQPYPQATFDVNGFADSTGSEATNRDLSAQRAHAVSRYLQSLGVEGSRIQAVAFSTHSPAASNATTQGRKSNRRVEVTVR
jgi:outer membrane protein OmpA-like peptidoglycan-associated protein